MVLFLKPSPRRDFLWNDSLEFKNHINENIKFIKSLSELNRSKLQVKKHFTKEFYNFDVKKILNSKIDKVNFSEQSYNELIKTKKLFLFINIHSTGFLETLSYNIPCIYVKDTYSEFRSEQDKIIQRAEQSIPKNCPSCQIVIHSAEDKSSMRLSFKYFF